MKKYIDYTTQELDELYANLSEVAQDFVYSDIIKDEVAGIGKETGLLIDKWDLLDTLVLETILGIVPSNMFTAEVRSRLGTESDITATIVAHMEAEIFSVIREESVEEYSEENEKNVAGTAPRAIYDNALNTLSTDPYRENIGGGRNNAPVITEEKLHLVDELFAAYSPKIKELTPADGSVRVPTEESRHVPELFAQDTGSSAAVPLSPSFGVITKASLEADDARASGSTVLPKTDMPFAGADKFDLLLKGLPPLETSVGIVSKEHTFYENNLKIEVANAAGAETESSLNIKPGATIHIEKSDRKGMIKLHITKSVPTTLAPEKTKPHSDIASPIPIVAPVAHYAVDPYKEIL